MNFVNISNTGLCEYELPKLPCEYLHIEELNDESEKIEEIPQPCPIAITDATSEFVLNSEKLTFHDDVKEIYCMELSTKFTSYNPGDVIGIITQNSEKDVLDLFRHLKIGNLANKKILVSRKSDSLQQKLPNREFLNKITTLNYLFTFCLDISCIPKKVLIRVLLEHTRDPDEKIYLGKLCSKEGKELYSKDILDSGKTFLDILLQHPSCCPPPARLLEHLPVLLPRLYSIASSPLISPNRIKIIFSVEKYKNKKEGLCTGMLKNIIAEQNEKRVKIYFRKSNGFTLPVVNVPLILIGTGTGISPFLGFLEHLKAQEKKGKVWLFYGCRFKGKDFLFETDINKYKSSGILNRVSVAFSRDDGVPKYVQDNIQKYGKEVTELLINENAMIFVCGDARNMGKDVEKTFVEVLQCHAEMSNDEAVNFIKKLKKEKRYLQDIWI